MTRRCKTTYPWAGEWPGRSALHFAAWGALYALYYAAFEFFYRGFMVGVLRDRWGLEAAVWTQALLSTLIHLGKPLAETLAAFPAGFLFAFLAIRTRSLLWPHPAPPYYRAGNGRRRAGAARVVVGAVRVLVTGAHGFIGSHLVEKLVFEGASVRALVSPWGELENLSAIQGPIDIVRADVSEPDTLIKVCEDVELVYHAAARVADYGPAAAFRRVNVGGTKNLLLEAERANVTRFVLVSSVAVHRYTGFRDADPRALPRDGDINAYARSKVAAESLLDTAQLETVTVRPGLWPFGPRDPNFRQVAAALKKGRLPLVDGGRAVINTAYTENLVDGLWLAGKVPRAAGNAYVIADAGAPSWKEVFSELARILGAPAPRLSLPGRFVEPLSETLERAYALIAPEAEPPLTHYRGALMRRDVHFSLAAAQRDLGYTPAVSWQEGLERTVTSLGRRK